MDVIDLYKNKDPYKEKGITITRVLSSYCQNNKITELLNKKDYVNIIKKYITTFGNIKFNEIYDNNNRDYIFEINNSDIYSSKNTTNSPDYLYDISSEDKKSIVKNEYDDNNKDDDVNDNNKRNNYIDKKFDINNTSLKSKKSQKKHKKEKKEIKDLKKCFI